MGVVDRPGIDPLDDVIADLACMRTRPYRLQSPYALGALARVKLATVLPRQLVAFADDGYGGRGFARWQMRRALEGCAVADDVDAAGWLQPHIKGGFLSMAELASLMPDPPACATRAVSDGLVGGGRWRALTMVVGGPNTKDEWRRLALLAPDAAAAERLSADDVLVMRQRIADYAAPFDLARTLAEDLVKACATMAAWGDAKWTRKPDGEVELKFRSTRTMGPWPAERFMRVEPLHPAWSLALALNFLGVVVDGADLQRQIGERYFRLRTAWATGEGVRLPNGRYIPARAMGVDVQADAAKKIEAGLPLFPEVK